MSSSNTAGRQYNKALPPIPLFPCLKQYQTKEIKVKHRFREQSSQYFEERETMLPIFNTDDIEQLINVIRAFNEACQIDILSLTTHQQQFQKFREVLRGEGRTTWDQVCNDYDQGTHIETHNNKQVEVPNSRNTAAFSKCQELFIQRYLNTGSYNIQRNYLISGCKMHYQNTPDKIFN